MTNAALDGFTQPVTVERAGGAPVLVKGRMQPATKASFEIQAVPQPLRPDEAKLLPELERSSDAFVFYTETELFVVNKVTKQTADVLLYDGQKWKVIAIDKHAEGVLDHFRAVAQRV